MNILLKKLRFLDNLKQVKKHSYFKNMTQDEILNIIPKIKKYYNKKYNFNNDSLGNLLTINLYQFANFKLNILLIGEMHSSIGLQALNNTKITQKYINSMKSFFDKLVLDASENKSFINFYGELDIPEEVNLSQKFRELDRFYNSQTYTTAVRNPNRETDSVLGLITRHMFYRARANPHCLKAINFDTRRCFLYIGSFIFQCELDFRNNQDYTILEGYGCRFIKRFYRFFKNIKKSRGYDNEFMASLLAAEAKRLNNGDNSSRITVDMHRFEENLRRSDEFNRLVGCYFKILRSRDQKTHIFDGKYKTSENIINYIKDRDKNISFIKLREIIIYYYMEVSLRILKEYYKCAYPHLMDRINPVEVVKHIRHPDIWMSDMYAFYRFFIRPKNTNQRITPIQETIILYSGDNHVENLISMIENIFNKPSEFGCISSRQLDHSNPGNIDQKMIPLYRLNYVDNVNNIKPKHKNQIRNLLTKSFNYLWFDFKKDDSYIIILKNDNVIGCFLFCKLVNLKKHDLRKKIINNHSKKKNGSDLKVYKNDFYIHDFAIHENERKKGMCKYLISCGIKFLQKEFSNFKTIWLIAKNPKYTKIKVEEIFEHANKCYSNFMTKEEKCKDNHEICYFYIEKSTDIKCILPISKNEPTFSTLDQSFFTRSKYDVLKYIQYSFKAICENKNYRVINTDFPEQKFKIK